MRIPLSTYRLQITAAFDLDAAASVLDYVTELGADWIYLSPLLAAEDGSDHGYDVIDHSGIDPVRGGAEALARLTAAATDAGRGILVDIVPNHMGVATPAGNAWWWDLLRLGGSSRYAEAFDVDWAAGGDRILLPVLGDGADELDRLSVVGDELHYYDNRFPLAPGTADDGADARTVHGRQSYQLVGWRRADAELNYRRFFTVSTLAGLKVETPWVFDESHREILRWVQDGLVQGLRVDHPDGLADPGGYLDRLRDATGGAYVLVEKILEGGEQLPANWATSGTTGYDALADFDRLLVDPAGQGALDALEARLQAETGGQADWPELVHTQKRAIADGSLRAEVERIVRLLPAIKNADDAVAELFACFPVYRSYLPVGAEKLHAAAATAADRRPDLAPVIDALLPMLADPGHPAAVRFQQTSGMVMAKGVEDTSYYRYSRLTSLNEVGADPGEFAVDAAEFHRRQQVRQATFPASMTTLSTHDTKRGEDVRARISVLAEIPAEWENALRALRAAAPLGDAPFENLLWQAIVGAWPASPDRLIAYAEKAAREAGTSTTWTAQNAEFETAMHRLVAATVDNPAVRTTLTAFVDRVRQAGWSNGLSNKLVQLTAPGVPDVYQGSELWEDSLVDPDNRRPVDYGVRRDYLARIAGGWLPPVDETGAAKLLVTTRALRLRREAPERFFRHLPVEALGARAENVIAFDRGDAVTIATRLPLGLAAAGGWNDTTVVLAGHPVIDLLTGARHPGGITPVAALLQRYPVALLVADDGTAPATATATEGAVDAR
ncbi:malto-oligosyltrehalose synthase [Cryobacterium sp. TMT1-21]|uniref:Malto-oligosyltrehalose synthase n=1 Tax=Cryobacterium shii TaxID=1259235 RepID=A0AAQ2C4C0_9MICO|nr:MULTISPECIES: malto-oligosyltrehalose synthase [Cryobacterium]TFC42299.1 malto-oligosyltrehalose synthase [Cryobacterium shii]TFC85963.1 malto-oligosyltrehalose synthase [Cryobacterium sp. TmT2-59]TFD13702.1 malto-oligosyltrehalose synthase [Cryobacterium sp. TMT4-10]TFD15933.1 malto-oligosyltrehalose synthase [Cryobacterium sp. TMT1-21]TFD39878.1 malto-oligosyltrehalose synthase [Cryobacterium sp. TMT2-10]